MSKIQGHLVLLMAPSGSGKKTLIDGLGELAEKMYFVKTYTSRAKREGATENPKYVFLTKEKFQEMIDAGDFIEWANFSGNLYGTSKTDVLTALEKPQVVFKEMELQGVEQMKKLIPEDKLTVIFINSGTWEELRERILSRAAISDTELELRRLRYEEEIEYMPGAEIVISNRNGEASLAQQNFKNIIAGIIESVDK